MSRQPGYADYNRSYSKGNHRFVSSRDRGRARGRREDDTESACTAYVDIIRRDQPTDRTSQTWDSREDNIGCAGIDYSDRIRDQSEGRSSQTQTQSRREDNKGGACTDHSERIRDQLAGRSSQTPGSRDTATCDHHQSSSDLCDESSGQSGREVEHQHESETQEHSRNYAGWKTRDRDHGKEDKNKREQQKTEEYETPGYNCQYCGGIMSKKEAIRQGEEVYHNKCLRVHLPYCQEAVAAFKELSRKKHVLYMAVPVHVIYGSKELDRDRKKKREFSDIKISELLNNVTALRNSSSGFLLVHLIGLDPEDKFTGAFDEFADVKLQGLISDESLFDDVYKKSRLSDNNAPELKKFTDILVLYAAAADVLTTSDFKTKVALDDCITDIPEQTLLKLIKDRRETEETFHEIPAAKNAEDMNNVFENRHIQTKAYMEPKTPDDQLVLNIFNKLRVAEYISAFSKNKDGGSYLLGLAEEQTVIGGYRSKLLKVTPVVIDDSGVVRKLLTHRVSANCLVTDFQGAEQPIDDLVKISFIPSRDHTGYVVHISVRSVNGIVFYDKTGPVAYRVDTSHLDSNSIIRLTAAEWFEAFRRRLH